MRPGSGGLCRSRVGFCTGFSGENGEPVELEKDGRDVFTGPVDLCFSRHKDLFYSETCIIVSDAAIYHVSKKN